jgi:hypothetical protein
VIIEAAALAFMAGDFIYHRWIEDHPQKPTARQEVMIPHADEGAPVPLIYGRVRARNPILVWSSQPVFANPYYEMNMFLVLGIPMDDGNGINRVHNMWAGDWKLFWSDIAPAMTGVGGPEGVVTVIGTGRNGEDYGTGLLEFLDGNPSQVLVNPGEDYTNAYTYAGRYMLNPNTSAGGGNLNFNAIPGYRGYVCVTLHGIAQPFIFGKSAGVPAYSFEASSYRDSGGYPAVGIYAQVGLDSNPINVLWDLYKAKFGKLGYDTSLLDKTSWQVAATTLYSEGHGYSRYITDASQVDDHILEILKQIDGVLRENPTTGKIELKLIRPDYDPATIPEITRANCDALVNFAASGWTNIINKIRLVYTNRTRDYVDDSELVQNQANAVGQNGQVNEQTLQMPGICETAQAQSIARRELTARSRPIIKCRALVDRSFLRVMQGDAVKLTWSNPDIAGLIFRVANVERGTLKDSKIALDLISDYFYTTRNQVPSWWDDAVSVY